MKQSQLGGIQGPCVYLGGKGEDTTHKHRLYFPYIGKPQKIKHKEIRPFSTEKAWILTAVVTYILKFGLLTGIIPSHWLLAKRDQVIKLGVKGKGSIHTEQVTYSKINVQPLLWSKLYGKAQTTEDKERKLSYF